MNRTDWLSISSVSRKSRNDCSPWALLTTLSFITLNTGATSQRLTSRSVKNVCPTKFCAPKISCQKCEVNLLSMIAEQPNKFL